MERFLAHIVQRSQTETPALAPRLAGRFEEARAPGGFAAVADDAIALVHAAPHGARDPAGDASRRQPVCEPAPASSPHAHARAAQPDPLAPSVPEMAVPTAQPGAGASGVATAPSTARPAPDPAAACALAVESAPSAGANPAARPLAPAARPARRIDAGQAGMAPARPGSADPAPDVPAAHGARLSKPTTSQPAPRTAAGHQSVAPSVPAAPERPHAGHPGALAEPPRRVAPAVAPASARAAQAAQPVHVTIGRVELRAAAPAAAAPARLAPARPALSLGDYLQRRDQAEGRR